MLLFCFSLLLAQGSTAQPNAGSAELHGRDGSVQTRALSALDLTDPRQAQAWRVRFTAHAALEVPAESAQLRLWSGESVFGELRGGQQENLVFASVSGLSLVVGLEELDALLFPARIPISWSQPVEPAKEGDRLYRRSREALDVLAGGTQSFSSKAIGFEINGIGAKQIPLEEVAALFIDREARELFDPKRREGAPVEVELIDGSRLQGALQRLSLAGCELVRASGERLEIPLRAILELSVRDGQTGWLSELAASEAPACSPFGDDLGLVWPSRIDRATSGGRLSVQSRVSPRGIGMHAPNRMQWTLDGSWKRLHGSVGVDDSTRALAARGSVVFHVLCDGRERWKSEVVRGGEAPRAMPPLELAGVRLLELVVEDAGDGFAGDRANWLDLSLSR